MTPVSPNNKRQSQAPSRYAAKFTNAQPCAGGQAFAKSAGTEVERRTLGWQDLPLEIQKMIVDELPRNTVASLQLTCKSIQEVINHDRPAGMSSWVAYQKKIAQKWRAATENEGEASACLLSIVGGSGPQQGMIAPSIKKLLQSYSVGGPKSARYMFEPAKDLPRKSCNGDPPFWMHPFYSLFDQLAQERGVQICLPVCSSKMTMYANRWPSLLFDVAIVAPLAGSSAEEDARQFASLRAAFAPRHVYRAALRIDPEGCERKNKAACRQLFRQIVAAPSLRHLTLQVPLPLLVFDGLIQNNLQSIHLKSDMPGSCAGSADLLLDICLRLRGPYFGGLESVSFSNYAFTVHDTIPWPTALRSLTFTACHLRKKPKAKGVNLPPNLKKLSFVQVETNFAYELLLRPLGLSKVFTCQDTVFPSSSKKVRIAS